MKLLLTPSKKAAKKVTDYKQIKTDAEEMLTLLNGNAFKGKYSNGFALSHAQVSNDPYQFFVVHKSWDNLMPEIICNARIIDKMEPFTFKEACLSFPFRDPINTRRYWRVVVEFETPTRYLGFFPTGFKTENMAFDGLAAVLFQHEIDHAHAQNIYTK